MFHILLSKLCFYLKFCTFVFVFLHSFQFPATYLLKSPLLFISGFKSEPNSIVYMSQPSLFLYYKINPSFICFGTIRQSLSPGLSEGHENDNNFIKGNFYKVSFSKVFQRKCKLSNNGSQVTRDANIGLN